jgi:hypothetical protein
MNLKIMKKHFLNFLFTIISALFFTAGYSQTTNTTAKNINTTLQFTNEDYNMGKIKSGAPLEYNVTIKNISTDTVSIKTVRVGCGCTTPKYNAGQVIQPGETTTITLGFNGSATGPFVKYADVFFGNGLSKQLKFSGDAVKQ